MQQWRLRRGFTLLELVLVIVIISLAAGIVGPLFAQTLVNWDISAEARILAGWIRQAQQRSIATQQEHSLWFTSGHYSLHILERPDLRVNIKTIWLKPTVTLRADDEFLFFDALGAPDAPAMLTLGSQSGASPRQVSIQVQPITGRVNISRLE